MASDPNGAGPNGSSGFRIGDAVPRVEDLRFVRGRYTDDIELPNAAHDIP